MTMEEKGVFVYLILLVCHAIFGVVIYFRKTMDATERNDLVWCYIPLVALWPLWDMLFILMTIQMWKFNREQKQR